MRPPREFPVGEDEAGSRLETFLRRRLGLARPVALKAVRKGWIRVDGKRVKSGGRRLAADEVVKVTNYGLPLPAIDGAADAGGEARAVDVPADAVARARASVRHADDDLVVSAKPSGVVVHRGSGHAWGWIDAVARAVGPGPEAFALTPVGRLDRDVSGLLALARTRGAARALFEQLRAGDLARTYLALVAGSPPDDAGEVDAPLEKAGPPGRERVAPAEAGRPSVTRWRVRERLRGGAVLLEVEIDTGRTHQIRAHLRAIGHPLLGDPRYTDDAARRLASRAGLERLFLHAAGLRLRHPRSGEARAWEDPLPADLVLGLAALA